MVPGMADLARQVGRRIAYYRQVRPAGRLSQERLAGRIGMSVSLLRKIERGTRPLPLRLLERVSRELGVQPHHLICAKRGQEEPHGRAMPMVEFILRRALSRSQVLALTDAVARIWDRCTER